MQEEKRNSIIPRIAMGLIFVLMAVYAIHHISSIFGEDITTIAAGVSTERTSVSGSGYVFRNETPLYSANGGLVDYLVSDGAKVGKGQHVASVYESMYTSSGRRMVALIDDRIELLEASLAYSENNMSELRRSVEEKYYSIMKKLADGEVASVSDEAEAMLMEMNAIRSLIDSDDSAVKQSLDELYTLRSEIFNAAGASVTESVEASGYFYAYADGYESVFTANAAAEAGGDQLYSIISGSAEAQDVNDNCYGKMSESSEWLFVLPISTEESGYFEEGITYSADLLSGGGESLPMTLTRKLEVSEAENTVLLVFSCDRLPDGGRLDRCFGISIEVDSVSGIYVPKSAIEYIDGQRGVYILKGSVVHFRAVEVIYSGNDYYLVSQMVESEGSNYAYLSSNELIIVNGQNMFEGRILD